MFKRQPKKFAWPFEADVALPVVKDFIKKVRERAVGHEVIDTLNPAQQIIKIVNEELTAVLVLIRLRLSSHLRFQQSS